MNNVEHYKELRAKPVTEAKPYLVDYLVKLDVLEDYAKAFTVGRAYDVLHERMRKVMGKPKGFKTTQYFWLWTHGIPLDGLRKMSRAQVRQTLEMIWAAKKAKAPATKKSVKKTATASV